MRIHKLFYYLVTVILFLSIFSYIGGEDHTVFSRAAHAFGSSSKVTTAISSGDDYAFAMAIQDDGKIILGGGAYNGQTGIKQQLYDHDYVLARYNSDLSLDTSFGNGGIVITPLDIGIAYSVQDVAIQDDGKIIATARLFVTNEDPLTPQYFSMIRYNSDGSLDLEFGQNGIVTTSFSNWSDHPHSIIILDNGKIILTGECDFRNPTDFCMAKYNDDGSLDTSFSGDGKVRVSVGAGYDIANKALLQPDGKIVLAGKIEMNAWSSQTDFGLIRFNSDGSVDTTFGSNGHVTTDFNSKEYIYDMALLPDGKLLAVGMTYNGSDWDVALARYDSLGNLDPAFGIGGKVITDFDGVDQTAHALLTQPDGKFLVAGAIQTGMGYDFAVLRYKPDGTLDTTFGCDGLTTVDFGGADDYGMDITNLADESILVSGHAHAEGKSDFDFALAYMGENGYCGANQPPIVDPGGPYSGVEGSAITLTGTASDPDGDPLSIEWTVDSSLCSLSDAHALQTEVTCADNVDFHATLTASDGLNPSVNSSADISVSNAAPVITSLLAPIDPVAISDQPVTVTAEFVDPGSADIHTVTLDWDFDTTTYVVDTVPNAISPVSQQHTYTQPGVYTVYVTVEDDDNGIATKKIEYIVIYDPDGGFVTGGGWIDAPSGAYAPDPTLTGKATFGFVSKYKKGATVPTGKTEFQFRAADLNFHSNSYDWLVIAGHKAMYKGTGTINGTGNYGFMLSAIDENLTPSTDVDRFRIKIWDKDNGDALVYDNQVECSDDADDADPCTEIKGGNIVIHQGQ